MSIILLERNKALQKKKITMPDDVQQERNLLYAKMEPLDSVHNSKGYKELKGDQNLENNPNYNKTKNNTKKRKQQQNTELTWNDLEQRDHKLRHSDKNPNSEYNLFHGPKYKNWISNEIKKRRNAVKPVLPNNIKPKSPNKVEGNNPTLPTKLEKQGISLKIENKSIYITKSQMKFLVEHIEDANEHPYYDYLNDFDAYHIFLKFLKHESIWTPLINPDMYHKALSEFVKYGELKSFPTKHIYQWMGIIMKNTAQLRAITEISGHADYYINLNDFLDVFFEEEDWDNYKASLGITNDFKAVDNFLYQEGFYGWAVLPDGSPASSDYGLNPIEQLIYQYDENMTPEECLVLVNKILDVYHMNGDLASAFIQGGSKALHNISYGQNK